MAKDPRLFHLIQRAHGALFRAAECVMKADAGITASQQGVLFVLEARDGLPISEIAEELKMGNSSLTGLIDRMSERGLVRREANEEDGRVQNIFIEPAGRALAEKMRFRVRRVNARLLEPFSAGEQRVIARFLEHVADHAAEIVFADGVETAQSKRRKQ